MLRTFSTFIMTVLMMIFVVCSNLHAAGEPDDSTQAVSGVLAGQFKINKKTPLANGRVFVYDKAKGNPSADSYVRVPDNIGTLDKDGKFSLDVPAGTYYLSAIKVPDNAAMGPPADGERIYFKKDPTGKIKGYSVTAGKKTNAGIISTSFPYKRHPDRKHGDITTISGFVTDNQGVPVEGAVILVYMDRDLLDKAYSVSEKTTKDGKFAVLVSDGGVYFLRVRSDYGGGVPKEGDFDPKELVEVKVAKGDTLSGITIQVKHQRERGPLY